MLQTEKDRRVTAQALIAFHDGKQVHIFKGEVEGNLVTEERGVNGWGFDPLFIVTGTNKTFSEMSQDEKMRFLIDVAPLINLKHF